MFYEPTYDFDRFEEFRFAVSRKVRFKAGRKYGWRCTDCGADFYKGTMIEMAHYDHDRSDPNYNTVEAVRPLCRLHHLEDSIWDYKHQLSTGAWNGLRLQAQRCYDEGLHTRAHIALHPDQLEEDRYTTVSTIEFHDMDPRDLINFNQTT